MSRWVFAGAMTLALVVAFWTLSLEVNARARAHWTPLEQLTVLERGVLSTLVLLIVLMTAFLVWFPVRLPVNLGWHAMVFSLYFLSKSSLILYRNITGSAVDRSVSLAVMGLAGVCLSIWIIMLKPSGESASIVMGHRWDQAEERRLIAQLKDVNSALTKMARQ
jgi:hypothetical protein